MPAAKAKKPSHKRKKVIVSSSEEEGGSGEEEEEYHIPVARKAAPARARAKKPAAVKPSQSKSPIKPKAKPRKVGIS